MSFKSFSRQWPHSVVLLAFTIFMGCGGWDWETVTGEPDPQLNVFGLISTDTSIGSFVVVHKTLGLSGSDQIQAGFDTVWYGSTYQLYPHYESKYLVKNATVLITDGTTSWRFVPRLYQGVRDPWSDYYYSESDMTYIDSTGTFLPHPNTDYSLTITTPEGLSLTGQTRTPGIAAFKAETIPDTIVLHRDFTLRWHPDPLNAVELTTGGDGWLCGSDNIAVVQPGDSIWTSSYPSDCFQNDWEPESMIMNITLKALDENYLGYFYQHSVDEFFSFFMGQGGEGPRYGVTGGYGVFGSFSRSHLTRVALR